MSLLIAQTTPKPLILGTGQGAGALAVGDCVPLKNAPAVVSLVIKWADYGASSLVPVTIDVDLNTLGAAQSLDYLRSIYIDNTFSATPVYAYFPDTGFTVTCPPFSVVLSPVWTNGKICKLFATGFADGAIPTTTYIFSNMHINALAMVPSLAVQNVPIIQFIGQLTQNSAGQFRFSANFPLGTSLGASRQIIYIAHSSGASAAACTAVAANGGSSLKAAEGLSSAGFCGVSIWRISGITASQATVNLSVDYGASITGWVCEVYAIYNVLGSVLSLFDSVGFTTPGPGILPTPNPGVALYGCTATGFALQMTAKGILNYRQTNATITTVGSASQVTEGITLNLNNSRVPSTSLAQAGISIA